MLPAALLAALLGATLLAAAGSKAIDRTGTAVAAATFGVHGRAARSAWAPLAVLEGTLAAGLLAGVRPAAWVAVFVLAGFAGAQAAAVVAGRAGAPCGCFGARSTVSWGSAAGAASLAAAAALVAITEPTMSPQLRVAALIVAALALLRAGRTAAPDGALDVAGEGPPVGARLALHHDPRLAFFVAPGCRLCRALEQPARELGATFYDERDDAEVWAAAAVPGAPYAVALAPDGTVLAKGTVNTRRQLASVVAAARGPAADPAPTSSRRGFIATAAAAVGGIAALRAITSLVRPGEAEAFHFCGHIYTTDGCPHPTGLPRIDTRGYPLRAADGKAIDDLGRPIDEHGAPVDEDGAPLLDPDGRPQPPATRTRICTAAGRRFGISTRTDGAWFRCCGGHVRKLTDCCTTSHRRINGDAALRGYCYGKRHVFCVMYVQTKVPC